MQSITVRRAGRCRARGMRMLGAFVDLASEWRRRRALMGLSAAQLADAGIPEEYARHRSDERSVSATIANLGALR